MPRLVCARNTNCDGVRSLFDRYERVFAILEDPKHVNVMRKIVDFGCAECKFINRLKELPRVREVVGVDVDRTLLESFVSVSIGKLIKM